MMRPAGRLLAVSAATAIVALAIAAATASAGINGPCSASLAGTTVANRGTGATDTPIAVAHDSSVPIVLSASGQLTHVKITLEFAGFTWVVRDKAVSTPVYRDTIPVKDYATYGVGLYKVKGTGTAPGLSCSGSALVRVKGNPFTSVAGIVGIVTAVLGAGGVLFGALATRAGGGATLRVARSAAAGLVAGFGVLVLLQEAALLYPTRLVAIVGLVLGVAVGAAAALLPLLSHPTAAGTGVTGRPATPHV